MSNENKNDSVQLLARQRLKEKLGGRYSDTTLWRMVKRGELPEPIRISRGRIAWIESEVDAKIEARAGERASLSGKAA